MRTPLRHVSLAGVFAVVVLAAYTPAGAPVVVVAAGRMPVVVVMAAVFPAAIGGFGMALAVAEPAALAPVARIAAVVVLRKQRYITLCMHWCVGWRQL